MVQEPRRLEHQQDHPPGRRVRALGGLELAIEVERFCSSDSGRRNARSANFRQNSRTFASRSPALSPDAGELAQVGRDVVGNLQGGIGGCLVPGFRDRRSALVANAPVIRPETPSGGPGPGDSCPVTGKRWGMTSTVCPGGFQSRAMVALVGGGSGSFLPSFSPCLPLENSSRIG